MNDILRQTGRTTRMAEQAVQLALCLKAVYVLVPDWAAVRKMKAEIDQLWLKHRPVVNHGIKVELFKDLSTSVDWSTFRLIGSHHNVELLIDHFLIEKELERRREALRRHAEEFAHLNKILYPKTI